MLSTYYVVIEPYGHHLHMLQLLSSLSEVISIVYSIKGCTGDHKYLLQVYYCYCTAVHVATSGLAQHSKLLTSMVFLDMPLWLLQTKRHIT